MNRSVSSSTSASCEPVWPVPITVGAVSVSSSSSHIVYVTYWRCGRSSRFGNRWRFASTVTRCPQLSYCQIFRQNTFSSRCDVATSMKVDHHVLIFLERWTVTCFVKLDVFPPQPVERFWHSRHYLLDNYQISNERCDLLSFVLVDGVVYGKRWRHQTAKQRHQMEPG